MVHAALLLLMLEAVPMDLVFTISLKRSTPNLQLTTSRRPITPSHEGRSGNVAIGTNSTLMTLSRLRLSQCSRRLLCSGTVAVYARSRSLELDLMLRRLAG